VARVAQSALLREIPSTVAAARLAVRYISAVVEARVGGDPLEVVADGANPRWLVGDTRGKGLPAVRLASVAATSFRDACAQRAGHGAGGGSAGPLPAACRPVRAGPKPGIGVPEGNQTQRGRGAGGSECPRGVRTSPRCDPRNPGTGH